MTGEFVADASVAVAWVVESQAEEATDQLLIEVERGKQFIVPVLWGFEIANTLVLLLRRKRLRPDQYARARQAAAHMAPTVDEEGTRLALSDVSYLADKHSLSIYDAAYLELAVRADLPLASRDAVLNKAAKSAGVKTLL